MTLVMTLVPDEIQADLVRRLDSNYETTLADNESWKNHYNENHQSADIDDSVAERDTQLGTTKTARWFVIADNIQLGVYKHELRRFLFVLNIIPLVLLVNYYFKLQSAYFQNLTLCLVTIYLLIAVIALMIGSSVFSISG